jgi:hypothetical protein
MQINKNWIPFFIAIAIGTAAMTYYIVSGRGSYDSGVRNLAIGSEVENIESADPKKIQVKCKNGENYEITFSEDQGSYDDLIFNACGTEGTQE